MAIRRFAAATLHFLFSRLKLGTTRRRVLQTARVVISPAWRFKG